MPNLPTLNYTTPEEFINYYYNQLKTELGLFDLQINKVGFIGFFMNLLGYTHFDLKQYYDSIFKEAFVGTAQTEESQYIHAAIYGYIPTFAVAATGTGTIEFDMVNWLPRRSSGVVRREVVVGYSSATETVAPLSAKFFIEDFQFIIDALYRFVEVEDNGTYQYFADVITADGTKLTISSPSPTITVPLYSTTQYNQKEISFVLKPYNFGTFQTYYFSIDAGHYLSDLKVFVTIPGSVSEEEYEIKYTKYLERGDSKCVFLRKITSINYVLEFGSGIRGNWVSGASIRLIIKTTRGASGNLINKTNTKIQVSGNALTYDYSRTSSGELITVAGSPMPVLQQPLISFEYSESGSDPLSGEDLRDAIVNFIQTRDNMISQQDFYNIADKYFDDFKFLYKKINVFDNIFYLCRAFRDRNQLICYTLNHSEPVMDLNATIDSTYIPTATAVTGGTLSDDVYGYFVVAIDEWGQSSPSLTVTAITSGSNNSIEISWPAVPYATKYRIYGRSPTFKDQYWEVDAPTLSYVDDGTDGVPDIEPTTYQLQPLYYRPIFTINGESFISPFVYKGNTRMNYYEGCILKDLTRIDFSDITLSALAENFNIPVIYLNLDYDETIHKTIIRLKSYQVINNLVFTISIYGANIHNIINRRMECFPLSNNEFTYIYENDETFGLFEDEIQVEVRCGVSDSILTYNHSPFNTVGANILNIKVNDPPPYSGTFTTITLTSGSSVTANTLVSDINAQFGRTIASTYVDDNGNTRIKLTPPALAGGEITQNIFIASTGSTCLNVLGLTGDDYSPAILNGPMTSLKFTNRTDRFYQLKNISDQLTLVRYRSNLGDTYVTNVPVMYNPTFMTNPDYYLDKFDNFISSAVFNENRMITDNVQCRLLNSYYIESPFIEAIFLQSGKIFTETYYNYLPPVVDTRNIPPTIAITGQRFRVGTSGVDAFSGHDNQIATYTGTGWDFYSPVYLAGKQQDFVLDSDTNIYYRWDGTNWINLPNIKLPLRMRVEIKCDKIYVQRNSIDLAAEKEDLTIAIAEYLQKGFSGTSVVFYNSLITEFVHTNRAYIKSVNVYVTDSSVIPNKMDNGVEILSDNVILTNLKNKTDIVRYSPVIVHWDVDNLDIVMYVE